MKDSTIFEANTKKMHRLILFFLATAIFLSSPAYAQKSQPKKVSTIDEQVIGDWALDSVALYENGIRVKDSNFFNEIASSKVRVLPSGKVIFYAGNGTSRRGGKVFVSAYDLLTSKKGQFISIDIAMNLCMRIELLSDKRLKLKFNGFAYSREAGMEVYFSKSTFPQEELVKNLSGNYIQHRPYSYLAATDDIPVSDTVIPVETPPSLFLSLGAEGQMGNYMGSQKDTGTWTLNQEDLTITLKGKRSTQKLEIITWESREKIYLRPAGAPQDSVIRLSQKVEMQEYFTSADDTVVVYDSTVVAAPATEYDGESGNMIMLCKSWKAVSSKSATEQVSLDTLDRTIRLNLLKDGTFTFIDGKKKHNGKWRSMPEDGRILLIIKGKEQLAAFEFDYNFSSEGTYSDYTVPEDLDPKLVFSFIPPKSKSVRTFVFERQK